jgi:hypothetical protein
MAFVADSNGDASDRSALSGFKYRSDWDFFTCSMMIVTTG